MLNIKQPDLDLLCAIGHMLPNLGALHIHDYVMPIERIGLTRVRFSDLSFLHLTPNSYVKDFYDGFGNPSTLPEILACFFKHFRSLNGLRIPLPFAPSESGQVNLRDVPMPPTFWFLELASFSTHVTVDIESLYGLNLPHLALVNVLVDPVRRQPSGDDTQLFYYMPRGPRLYLGGSSQEATFFIYNEILKRRP